MFNLSYNSPIFLLVFSLFSLFWKFHFQIYGVIKNLYSSVVINKEGKTKVLKKAVNNNREERLRPESTQKAEGMKLNKDSKDDKNDKTFAQEWGAFGYTWARQYSDHT